jgi:hypothetical protein
MQNKIGDLPEELRHELYCEALRNTNLSGISNFFEKRYF